MKKRLNKTGFQASVVLLFLLTVFTTTAGRSEEEQKSDCCFTREGYQGICRVTPAKDETCESILSYLNSAGTVGKSYCGGSKLRGDWKQVECVSTDQKAE
jgi:hypothetical protein